MREEMSESEKRRERGGRDRVRGDIEDKRETVRREGD